MKSVYKIFCLLWFLCGTSMLFSGVVLADDSHIATLSGISENSDKSSEIRTPPLDRPVLQVVVRGLGELLTEESLDSRPMDEAMARHAMEIYLQSLDPQRCFFLQRDIDTFMSQWSGFQNLAKFATRDTVNTMGNATETPRRQADSRDRWNKLAFAVAIYRVYQERVLAREIQIQAMLQQPLDFSSDEEYTPDRRDAAYFQTNAEADHYWRQRIRYEYLSLESCAEDQAIADAEAMRLETEYRQKDQTQSNISAETLNQTNQPEQANPADSAKTTDQMVEASTVPAMPTESIAQRLTRRYTTMRAWTLGQRGSSSQQTDMLLETILNAFIQAYDPQAVYFAESSLSHTHILRYGVGLVIESRDGEIVVTQIFPQTPAARTPLLRVGDRVVAIGRSASEPMQDTMGLPMEEIVSQLHGPRDTPVRIQIRSALGAYRTIVLCRDAIDFESQRAQGIIFTIDGRS